MTGKQNFIFWIGLLIIFLNFYFSGAFKKLSTAVFGPGGWTNPTTPTASASGGSSNPLNSFNPFPLGFTIPGTNIRIPIP